MVRLTVAVAGKTLFDTDTEAQASEVARALTDIMKLFPRFALPFGPLISALPLPSNRRYERGRRRLDQIVYGLIEERRRDGRDRGDLLSMFMLARDEDGGPGMTDLQLHDEVMTLLLAGHETTANALSWTLYQLAQSPEVEARLVREVEEVLGGRPATGDDLPRLPYAEMVLAESMRLFPPAWALGRRALKDQYLGNVPLPAGSLVMATIVQRWSFRLVPGHPVEPQALITLRPRYGLRVIPLRRPTH
jgi:cytochrome P450